jgi:hypothetical protein
MEREAVFEEKCSEAADQLGGAPSELAIMDAAKRIVATFAGNGIRMPLYRARGRIELILSEREE